MSFSNPRNPPGRDTTSDSELSSIHANEVKGLDCPACGHPTLMIFDGYITCTLADCPNPDFADAIAQEANKARIDELNKLPVLQNNTERLVTHVWNRIAQLTADKEQADG